MTNFLKFLRQNWPELLTLTREHIFLVLLSTGFAVLVGVPLGILLTRVKSLRTPVLGFANIMQTVPSLALFGLLIPIPFIGGIGAKTAVIALALYALLPVIRNTVTGILGIDPKIREAATAMGMTGWQRLRMVELPLAVPVMLTGIRVAVVISVGVATVAAAVGAGGSGHTSFAACGRTTTISCSPALSRLHYLHCCSILLSGNSKSHTRSESGTRLGRRMLIGGLLTAALAVVIGLSFVPDHRGESSASVLPGNGKGIVVGSKDFTESVILAEILAQMLEKQGVMVERQFELGGNLPQEALLSKQIDVYPEYTGTAYTAILKHPPLTDPQAVYDETKREYAEKFGLVVSPQIGFANDFAILVRGEDARKYNLKTISDAVPLARNWQAGFGQDFMSRADGYPGFVKAYGFTFAKQPREMDLSLIDRALAAGQLDIVAGASTDGLIPALDLFQLEDDRHYFPPYQAVFIARSDGADTLSEAFRKLNNAISTEEMRKMNYEVDGNKRSPRDVAGEWLSKRK